MEIPPHKFCGFRRDFYQLLLFFHALCHDSDRIAALQLIHTNVTVCFDKIDVVLQHKIRAENAGRCSNHICF